MGLTTPTAGVSHFDGEGGGTDSFLGEVDGAGGDIPRARTARIGFS